MGNIIDDTHNLLASGLEQSVWLESETNVIDVFSPIQASNVHLCHVCVKKFVQSLHCLPLPTSVLYYLVLLNYGLLGIGTINNHFLAPPVLHRLSNKCVGWIWRYDKSWPQCMYVCAKSSIDHILEDFGHPNVLPKSYATCKASKLW